VVTQVELHACPGVWQLFDASGLQEVPSFAGGQVLAGAVLLLERSPGGVVTLNLVRLEPGHGYAPDRVPPSPERIGFLVALLEECLVHDD